MQRPVFVSCPAPRPGGGRGRAFALSRREAFAIERIRPAAAGRPNGLCVLCRRNTLDPYDRLHGDVGRQAGGGGVPGCGIQAQQHRNFGADAFEPGFGERERGRAVGGG